MEVKTVKTIDKDLVFIDVETSGLRDGYNEIIDIGIIRTDSKGILKDKYNKKFKAVHPERFSKKAREITGYRDDNNYPYMTKCDLGRIYSIMLGGIYIAHNPTFDRKFIERAFLDYDINFEQLGYRWVGTESLCWPLVLAGMIEKPSLNGLLGYFGFEEEPEPHSGLYGAEMCRRVYFELTRIIGVK